jgi:hypothetical protein
MNTTQTTTGTETIGRWAMATALAAVLGLGLAAPAAAQYQRVQSAPAAVGSQVWHNDGWAYVMTARGWARTNSQRVFPQRNNGHLVDIYNGGRWVQRIDTSQPGWIFELRSDVQAPLSWVKYPANAPISPATTYYLLNNQQWVTLPQLQMAQGMSNRGAPMVGNGLDNQMGVLGGYGTTPVIRGGSSVGGAYVLGGNTAASQRTAAQVAIDAALAPSRQRTTDMILAPNCQSSYYGCR